MRASRMTVVGMVSILGTTGVLPAQAPARTLPGHTSSVMAVAYSPDGKTLVSSSRDASIKIWDAQTGKLLHNLTEHKEDVYSVDFTARGDLLVSGSGDKSIKLWDTRTWKVLRTLEGHTDIVRSAAFSPDRKSLVSAGVDKTVRLWDVASGTLKRTFQGHTARVKSAIFSPDGATIASAASDRTIRLWDARTGDLRQVLEGHTGDLETVAYSPDGKLLASSSGDSTVRLWELATGKVAHTLAGHQGEVDSVTFSPDGKTAATGCKDQTVKLWDPQTGALRRTITGPQARVECLAFSPDGKTLAGGSAGPEALVWVWSLSAPAVSQAQPQRLPLDREPGWIAPHPNKVAPVAAQAAEPLPVKERKDESYATGENSDPVRHRLDLYLPGTKKPFPLVMFVHGGAWRSGTKDLYGRLGHHLAGRGIGVAVSNYRLSPAVKHPEHVKDVARAFAWVEKQAKGLGADPERLYLCGHSAGAHLVTLLALDPRYLAAEKVPVGRIRGVIGISGPYALGPRIFPEVFGEDPAARDDAFPLNHVRDQPAARLPSFLLLVAERDYAGLPLAAIGLERALEQHGVKVKRQEIADTDHISIIVKAAQPESAVSRSLLEYIHP